MVELFDSSDWLAVMDEEKSRKNNVMSLEAMLGEWFQSQKITFRFV